jgi:hypothetical protein
VQADQIEKCVILSVAGSAVEVQIQQYILGNWLTKTDGLTGRRR